MVAGTLEGILDVSVRRHMRGLRATVLLNQTRRNQCQCAAFTVSLLIPCRTALKKKPDNSAE